jgi:hypothetical protein
MRRMNDRSGKRFYFGMRAKGGEPVMAITIDVVLGRRAAQVLKREI